MAKVRKVKKKKKKVSTKRRSGSFLGFLIKITLLCLVLGIGFLKHIGVNNLDDFKAYAKKDPRLRKILGYKPPVDHLAAAENVGKKFLNTVVAKEKRLKAAHVAFQKFLDHRKKREFNEEYKMYSSKDRLDLLEEDFVFSKNASSIKWKDPVINEEFKKLVDDKYSEKIKDIILKDKNAEVIVETSFVKVRDHLPDSKDIPNYYALSESDVEKVTADLVLEKLKSGVIPVIKKKLIHYMILEDKDGWKIIKSKGIKEFSIKKDKK